MRPSDQRHQIPVLNRMMHLEEFTPGSRLGGLVAWPGSVDEFGDTSRVSPAAMHAGLSTFWPSHVSGGGAAVIDLDRLLKLRLVVARHGEMDRAGLVEYAAACSAATVRSR